MVTKKEDHYQLSGKRDYCPECGGSRIIYSMGNLDEKKDKGGPIEWKIRCGYCPWSGKIEDLLNSKQADKLQEKLRNERREESNHEGITPSTL